MNTTFQNSAQVLSIGIFFTLMIVGLMSSLPQNLLHGLVAHGVPADVADRVAHLSPVSTLFAAFLGYDPVQHLIGAHALSQLPLAQQHTLTGRRFFPGLISAPFRAGLHAALDFAIVASLLAAGASWLRGGRYVYSDEEDGPAQTSNRSPATTTSRPAESTPPSAADVSGGPPPARQLEPAGARDGARDDAVTAVDPMEAG